MRVLVLSAALLAMPAMAQEAVPPHMVLLGAEWTLTRLDGQAVATPNPPTLTMTMAGAFAGFSGCNRYFGQMLFDGQTGVSASRIGMTRMACPREAMALESAFTRALQDVTSWQHAAGVVTFEGNGGALRFERR